MLLMLALPLQALASAGLLGCVVARHAVQEQMATDGGMRVGCHAQGTPDASPAQHNCDHCAACALASMLPIPVAVAASIVVDTPSYDVQFAALLSGFISAGPERPPRRIPA
jgi:hypothetical protein